MDLKRLLETKIQLKVVNEIKEKFQNQVVLITGAAGSIGSALSTIIANQCNCTLVLLDTNEFGLYNLQQQLSFVKSKNIEFVLGDICDKKRIAQIFKQHKPTIVYHAAAYKHVPLMESQPYEAIKVNLKGTKIVAKASKKWNVQHFILISTDKAVHPTSIMGATKRLAELVVRKISSTCKSNFKIIRFGNIPYSNGSVLPLFENQIKNNKVITITHKEVTRYFISMENVCESLLKALFITEGDLLVCDMGKPIRIVDLARKLIHTKTFKNNETINFEFIGLRAGEKLFETLNYDEETDVIKTVSNFKVYYISEHVHFERHIKKIIKAPPETSFKEIKQLITQVIPTSFSGAFK